MTNQSNKPYPKSIQKDVKGNILEVGDKVVFCIENFLYVGHIEYFTPQGVTCSTIWRGRSNTLKNIKDTSSIIKL